MLWHYQLHPSVELSNPHNSFDSNLLHPTHATLRQADGELHWSSRHHRKHRYNAFSPSQRTRKGRAFFRRLINMTHFEVWNISWWYAIMFTLGSIVWVINGFFAFLPNVNSHAAESDASIGWTAWLGATIFEFGAIFGLLEAWNRDDTAQFGWNVEKHLLSKSTVLDKENANRSHGTDEQPHESRWKWFSTDPKYFRELGFLGAFSQVCAATIFWISGWTAIPSIQTAISEKTGVLDGIYWTPQVVGGSGFIISSTFIMLESQKKWYKPEALSLGWHVGFWNFVGAVGFTLSGGFGYAAEVSTGADYQSTLTTFWGGWAFLIGSVIQWYKAVNSID